MMKLAAPLLLLSLTACHDRIIEMRAPAEPDKPGQMTVTGTATLDISPDCADLTMTVTSDSPKAGAATASVQSKEKAVVEALEKQGIAEKDLKLSLVTLEPIYEQDKLGFSQIYVHTYRASITITATTHDFSKIAPMMEASADAGATQLSSNFRRSDLPEQKKKVREMALKAAKEKAEQTAATLGIKLGRITSVQENAGGYMWNATYFPQVANAAAVDNSAVALGGSLQPLTLDVVIGYELAKET